jgi:hypothetical protein
MACELRVRMLVPVSSRQFPTPATEAIHELPRLVYLALCRSLEPADRALLAAISRVLPPDRGLSAEDRRLVAQLWPRRLACSEAASAVLLRGLPLN